MSAGWDGVAAVALSATRSVSAIRAAKGIGTMITTTWRKSILSQPHSACIELANTGLIRDSTNPHGPTLPVELPSMLAAIKAGHLDR